MEALDPRLRGDDGEGCGDDGKGCHGYTLLEVMVALALLGIVLAMVGNALASVVANAKLNTAADVLLAGVHRARGEAITRNQRVVLCRSSDGATCALKGDWSQGAIAFQDTNRNAEREPEEAVIYQEQALPPGLRAEGNAPVARFIAFDGEGVSRLASGAFQAGTVTVCRESAEPTEARQIIVNAGGRPRVQKTQVEACR